jgi:hypothetical protein
MIFDAALMSTSRKTRPIVAAMVSIAVLLLPAAPVAGVLELYPFQSENSVDRAPRTAAKVRVGFSEIAFVKSSV